MLKALLDAFRDESWPAGVAQGSARILAKEVLQNKPLTLRDQWFIMEWLINGLYFIYIPFDG